MFFIYFNQNNLCNWLNAEADRRIQLSSIKWDIKEIWKKDKTYHVSYSSLFNKVVIYVILEKAEEPEIKLPTSVGLLKKQESSWKTSISVLLTMPKPLTVWITTNCGKFWNRWGYQTTWPASWEICMQVRKQQLELDMEQQTGST